MKQIFEEIPQNLANFVFSPKIRLECVDPGLNHYKFYEIETEPALFFPKITKRWGRIGWKPRFKTIELQYLPDLIKEVGTTLRIRYNHGYKIIG